MDLFIDGEAKISSPDMFEGDSAGIGKTILAIGRSTPKKAMIEHLDRVQRVGPFSSKVSELVLGHTVQEPEMADWTGKFGRARESVEDILVRWFNKYKVLKVFDFKNTQLEHLPEEVGNLVHLSSLSLKNSKVTTLPKSIGKLLNLQTLNLKNTLLVELPIEINKLRNLRHLLASFKAAQGVIVKEGIGSLQELETLMIVEANLSGISLIQELKRLRNLKRLEVTGLTTDIAGALCLLIEKMTHLQSLSLQMIRGGVLDLQSSLSAPIHLERLVLKGLLHSFPDWFLILHKLRFLCLSLSRSYDDPLPYLCFLPNLESLRLYRAYEGERLRFHEGGFRKLKQLTLREMQGLEAVEIEENARPCLDKLRIGPSPCLNKVPSGIKYLGRLEMLAFYDMPHEFVRNVQPVGGSEHWKVNHVVSVFFYYRFQARQYIMYRLGESDLLLRLEGSDMDLNRNFKHALRLSFSYGEDEEDVAPLPDSVVQLDDVARLSFSSDGLTFFTDDVEE